MFLAHYIIPLVIYIFYRKKEVLFLLFGNLIDLDHIFYRMIGKVDWFGSACGKIGQQCSWNFYPLHNLYSLFFGFALFFMGLITYKKYEYSKYIMFLGLGIVLHLTLDLIHQFTGFAF